MKKGLQVVLAVLVTANSYSQDVILSSHFNSSPTIYQIDQAAPVDTGFVSGTNILMQKAKMQKFDQNFGVSGSGSIKGVYVGIPAVGGNGTIQVEIYPDVNGQADFFNPIASTTIDLTSINTDQLNFTQVGNFGKYNVMAMFSSPVAIPSNQKFWAGVVLPSPGGAAVIYTTNIATPFAQASTHSGEIWADDSFHFMNGAQTWGLDLAFAIFPVVNFSSSANLTENNSFNYSVYPNPTNGLLHIESEEEISQINILNLSGSIVKSSELNMVDVSELSTGMYVYEVILISGKVARGNFAKI